MSEMGGVIPDTAAALMKHLPGVGRYTAGESKRELNWETKAK